MNITPAHRFIFWLAITLPLLCGLIKVRLSPFDISSPWGVLGYVAYYIWLLVVINRDHAYGEANKSRLTLKAIRKVERP